MTDYIRHNVPRTFERFNNIKKFSELVERLSLENYREIEAFFYSVDCSKLSLVMDLGEWLTFEADLVWSEKEARNKSYLGTWENIVTVDCDRPLDNAHVNFYEASVLGKAQEYLERNRSFEGRERWKLIAYPYAYARKDYTVSIGLRSRYLSRIS